VVIRVRQHVNPLANKYQTPVSPPEWDQIFALPSLPLHLDIGCGKGRFVLHVAQLEPSWNFLGLEIREPLVEEANRWRDELGLTNLHYLFCNVNNSLLPILDSLPEGVLQRVTIQFPDPWFKNRHVKRRVVQPELVEEIAKYLIPGGMVFLQSDVEIIATEMRDRFLAHSAFQIQAEDWLSENPLPVATEREKSTLARGEFVYRTVFLRSEL
jgi:tRNA (guanine-N7-)-methyltransferase